MDRFLNFGSVPVAGLEQKDCRVCKLPASICTSNVDAVLPRVYCILYPNGQVNVELEDSRAKIFDCVFFSFTLKSDLINNLATNTLGIF